MMYVYLLKSKAFPDQKYIGMTENLNQRLNAHNSGLCKYTSKFKPWKIIAATWFSSPEIAVKFEKYLKIGSDHAFAKKHFW